MYLQVSSLPYSIPLSFVFSSRLDTEQCNHFRIIILSTKHTGQFKVSFHMYTPSPRNAHNANQPFQPLQFHPPIPNSLPNPPPPLPKIFILNPRLRPKQNRPNQTKERSKNLPNPYKQPPPKPKEFDKLIDLIQIVLTRNQIF